MPNTVTRNVIGPTRGIYLSPLLQRWLLAGGFWNDNGQWDDTARWPQDKA